MFGEQSLAGLLRSKSLFSQLVALPGKFLGIADIIFFISFQIVLIKLVLLNN